MSRLTPAKAFTIRAPTRSTATRCEPACFGNLLFNATIAALRTGGAGSAEDLLAAAHAAAIRSRGDAATETALVGPRVAALQNVELAARAGDPEQALRLTATVPDTAGDVPAFREAGHRLVLAAAAADLRHDRDALAWLAEHATLRRIGRGISHWARPRCGVWSTERHGVEGWNLARSLPTMAWSNRSPVSPDPLEFGNA
ncbi:hypothetical protein [Amycolatopsis sp. SID8362]|uniref:hypothetical protein n=1 Tax=Amycolatopsis sp. SID8362 TaxID=2690346 RepID=UPI001EF354FA|nr:hypothetical protein [Amycolatopsis sp. SID8362]